MASGRAPAWFDPDLEPVGRGRHQPRSTAIRTNTGLETSISGWANAVIVSITKLTVAEDPMQSIDLIRDNLTKSRDRVLARVEDMREHCFVTPTRNGGGHTIWVLGHLAYIEQLVIRTFMLGEANPLAAWEQVFDGADVSEDVRLYPPFDEVLARCRDVRESTLALLASLSEADLDRASAKTPRGFEETFGTYRLCLQYVADHWYMHRGQLADARRSAGLPRMWV